jgi:hypothetical protein
VCHMKRVLRPESSQPGTLQASELHSEAIQVDASSPMVRLAGKTAFEEAVVGPLLSSC